MPGCFQELEKQVLECFQACSSSVNQCLSACTDSVGQCLTECTGTVSRTCLEPIGNCLSATWGIIKTNGKVFLLWNINGLTQGVDFAHQSRPLGGLFAGAVAIPLGIVGPIRTAIKGGITHPAAWHSYLFPMGIFLVTDGVLVGLFGAQKITRDLFFRGPWELVVDKHSLLKKPSIDPRILDGAYLPLHNDETEKFAISRSRWGSKIAAPLSVATFAGQVAYVISPTHVHILTAMAVGAGLAGFGLGNVLDVITVTTRGLVFGSLKKALPDSVLGESSYALESITEQILPTVMTMTGTALIAHAYHASLSITALISVSTGLVLPIIGLKNPIDLVLIAVRGMLFGSLKDTQLPDSVLGKPPYAPKTHFGRIFPALAATFSVEFAARACGADKSSLLLIAFGAQFATIIGLHKFLDLALATGRGLIFGSLGESLQDGIFGASPYAPQTIPGKLYAPLLIPSTAAALAYALSGGNIATTIYAGGSGLVLSTVGIVNLANMLAMMTRVIAFGVFGPEQLTDGIFADQPRAAQTLLAKIAGPLTISAATFFSVYTRTHNLNLSITASVGAAGLSLLGIQTILNLLAVTGRGLIYGSSGRRDSLPDSVLGAPPYAANSTFGRIFPPLALSTAAGLIAYALGANDLPTIFVSVAPTAFVTTLGLYRITDLLLMIGRGLLFGSLRNATLPDTVLGESQYAANSYVGRLLAPAILAAAAGMIGDILAPSSANAQVLPALGALIVATVGLRNITDLLLVISRGLIFGSLPKMQLPDTVLGIPHAAPTTLFGRAFPPLVMALLAEIFVRLNGIDSTTEQVLIAGNGALIVATVGLHKILDLTLIMGRGLLFGSLNRDITLPDTVLGASGMEAQSIFGRLLPPIVLAGMAGVITAYTHHTDLAPLLTSIIGTALVSNIGLWRIADGIAITLKGCYYGYRLADANHPEQAQTALGCLSGPVAFAALGAGITYAVSPLLDHALLGGAGGIVFGAIGLKRMGTAAKTGAKYLGNGTKWLCSEQGCQSTTVAFIAPVGLIAQPYLKALWVDLKALRDVGRIVTCQPAHKPYKSSARLAFSGLSMYLAHEFSGPISEKLFPNADQLSKNSVKTMVGMTIAAVGTLLGKFVTNVVDKYQTGYKNSFRYLLTENDLSNIKAKATFVDPANHGRHSSYDEKIPSPTSNHQAVATPTGDTYILRPRAFSESDFAPLLLANNTDQEQKHYTSQLQKTGSASHLHTHTQQNSAQQRMEIQNNHDPVININIPAEQKREHDNILLELNDLFQDEIEQSKGSYLGRRLYRFYLPSPEEKLYKHMHNLFKQGAFTLTFFDHAEIPNGAEWLKLGSTHLVKLGADQRLTIQQISAALQQRDEPVNSSLYAKALQCCGLATAANADEIVDRAKSPARYHQI